MTQFQSSFQIGSLNGANGFQISGVANSPVTIAFADTLPTWAATAGDINGDGFDDLVVGAMSYGTASQQGAAYIIYGRASGAPLNLNVSTLDGTTGFKVAGNFSPAYELGIFGSSVSAAGDLNDDGIDDFVVGAVRADTVSLGDNGAAFVVFGSTTPFAPTVLASSLNGSNGFRLNGGASGDSVGLTEASAGDINGDGIDDLIVGASRADPNGSASGASYIVFGKTTPFSSTLDLSTLSGSDGFRIVGETASDLSGRSVSGIGDLNGDGFDDVVIGAAGANGTAYVLFGASSFSGDVNLSALTGSNGFKIVGEAAGGNFGYSVSSAGDINGDGLDDVIIGAHGANGAIGASYVVFGRVSAFSATLDLSLLNGSDGFRIDGVSGIAKAGNSVSSAGDVNGDGFDDLLIGANGGLLGGSATTSFVVFGKASGWSANLDLADLDGDNGFRVIGGVNGRSAGDFNGDGFSDTVFSTVGGGSFVVFGHRPDEAVVRTGTGIANAIRGSDFADSISGLGGGDTLYGYDGSDTLDGGTGDDTMVGGKGDDTYVVDSLSDVVTELAGEGTDTVVSSVDYLLGAALENLTADGGGNITLTGNAKSNVLTGNSGNNLIIGGAGIDVMAGGAGNDTYDLDILADSVIELASGGTDTVRSSTLNLDLFFYLNVENLTATGSADLRLIGNEAVNTITGNSGNNFIDAGNDSSTDFLAGGDGNDIYVVSVFDQVTETSTGGFDTVRTAATHLNAASYANVEVLEAIGALDINLTGDGNANRLVGNTGNNFIFGGGGIDEMAGGAGNDTYDVDDFDDTVSDLSGIDLVRASAIDIDLDNYSGIENATAYGNAGIALFGTGNANVLTGDAGGNLIDGRGGGDTLAGGGGNDTYEVYAAGDAVIEGATGGTDTVRSGFISLSLASYANVENLALSGSGNLDLTGNGSANALAGNTGANILTGGAGRDTMTGGAGSAHDVFDFNAVIDTGKTAATRDIITDFVHLVDDIDLSTIDASTKKARDQAFSFVGAAAFSKVAGELHIKTEGGNKVVEGDVNGDGKADFQIQINGNVALTAGDFVL